MVNFYKTIIQLVASSQLNINVSFIHTKNLNKNKQAIFENRPPLI